MLKVLGVGLSRTGTTSLSVALENLGLRCIHYDRDRLTRILMDPPEVPDFRVYDDVDAVTDLPAAHFYRELLAAYPDAKAILTYRPVDDWWRSVSRHFNEAYPVNEKKAARESGRYLRRARAGKPISPSHNLFRFRLRNLVYGNPSAVEFVYRRAYVDHIRRVRNEIPEERLMVMDISTNASWRPLCEFLGCPVPDLPFPWKNKSPAAA